MGPLGQSRERFEYDALKQQSSTAQPEARDSGLVRVEGGPSEPSDIINFPLLDAGRTCSRAIAAVKNAGHVSVQTWARDRLIDFNHWATGVGLFAKGRNALDHRLLRNSETVRVILSVLEMLTIVFRRIHEVGAHVDSMSPVSLEEDRHSPSSSLSFSPWSSADEDSTSSGIDKHDDASSLPRALNDICNDAERLIDRLIDLGVAIRQSGISSRLLRADSTFNEHLYGHLRKHLELLLQLSNLQACVLLEDRQKNQTPSDDIASLASTALRPDQVHLIHANLRRRHRFAFARKRASTLAFPQGIDEPIAVSKALPIQVPELDKPILNPDNGQIVTESTALSTQQTATSVSQNLDAKVGMISSQPTAEELSIAVSTAPSVSAYAMDYPKAPRASQSRAFKCPCCCQVLGKAIGKDHKKWRKHVANDLYPYTCPIIGCTSNTMFFIKRKDWKAHIQEYHQTVSHWLCSVCGENTVFNSQHKFEKHVEDRHSGTVEKKSIPAMVELCTRKTVKLPSSCPVCNLQRDWLELDFFVEHLADCIHGFSLASLPWNDARESNPSTLNRGERDRISTWLTNVENDESTEDPIRTTEMKYLSIQDIDLSSKDASDGLLPTDEYFNDNDRPSRISDTSANADVASTRRSLDEAQASDSEIRSNRRPASIDSDRAGRVWARDVDDPWWPCILALDGGGIRGYSTLLILKALMHEVYMWELRLDEEDMNPAKDSVEYVYTDERHEYYGGYLLPRALRHFAEEELLPCHYFDFMYGSSSGGLIATLLGRLRMTVAAALAFWPKFGDAAFGRRRSLIPLATKYYHQPLENLMRDTVKHRCRDHSECGGEDLHPWDPYELGFERPFDVDMPRVCQSCCLTATHDENITEAYLLRTYHLYYGDGAPNWVVRYNEGADSIPVWQAVRATLAAPFFFEQVSAEVRGTPKFFKDAGIRENNPSGAAFSEFHTLYYDRADSPAMLLSIGAGRPENIRDGFGYPAGPVGRLPFVGKFLEKRAVIQNLLIKYTEGEKQHLQMREVAHGEHRWYKRLNVDKNLGNVPMDEWSRGEWNGNVEAGGATLTKIEQATHAYLQRQFDAHVDSYAPPSIMLSQTAEKLVRQRRAREQQGGERWEIFVGNHLPARKQHGSARAHQYDNTNTLEATGKARLRYGDSSGGRSVFDD